LFDPDGPGEDHHAFSNNNLSSFTSRHAEFDGSLLGTTFGYSYFRGLDDHRPIFLSRQIHLVVTYGLAILTGALAIFTLASARCCCSSRSAALASTPTW
jgi:hypothetical protein